MSARRQQRCAFGSVLNVLSGLLEQVLVESFCLDQNIVPDLLPYLIMLKCLFMVSSFF
jgi:hypothetical protein